MIMIIVIVALVHSITSLAFSCSYWRITSPNGPLRKFIYNGNNACNTKWRLGKIWRVTTNVNKIRRLLCFIYRDYCIAYSLVNMFGGTISCVLNQLIHISSWVPMCFLWLSPLSLKFTGNFFLNMSSKFWTVMILNLPFLKIIIVCKLSPHLHNLYIQSNFQLVI